MRFVTPAVISGTLLLAACGASGPTFERFDDDTSEWVELGPLAIESVDVDRAGEDVRASVVLTAGQDRIAIEQDRIAIEMELYLEPPARFVRGTHQSRIGGAEFGGVLGSDYVEFFGGQNEGESLGGAFTLEDPGGVRYRVRFPPTPEG
jgi:hypothetical protein